MKTLRLSNFVVALETLIINIKRKQNQIKEGVMERVKIGHTLEKILFVVYNWLKDVNFGDVL